MYAATGLPDPDLHADFYAAVPTKRLIAWGIDMGITFVLSAPFMLPFALLGIVLIFPFFLIPVIWVVVGTLYRWMTISSGSATWGMRIMAIELRDHEGRPLSSGLALMHTLASTFSFSVAPLQAVSVVLMAVGDKGQGLTDMLLGTAMLNREAR